MAYSRGKFVIGNTEAVLAADNEVYDPPFELWPTDGPGLGKHKQADGIHTYAQLPFVEDAAGGNGITELTGHVTAGPGTGSQVATIPANTIATAMIVNTNVTYPKLQNVSANSLVGNNTGSAASATNIPIGSGLAFEAGALVGQNIYIDAVAPAPGAILVPFTGQTAGGLGAATIYLTDDGLITGVPTFASWFGVVSCYALVGTTVNPVGMFGAQTGSFSGGPLDPVVVQVWRGVDPVVDASLQVAQDGIQVQIWVAGIPA